MERKDILHEMNRRLQDEFPARDAGGGATIRYVLDWLSEPTSEETYERVEENIPAVPYSLAFIDEEKTLADDSQRLSPWVGFVELTEEVGIKNFRIVFFSSHSSG